MRLFSLILLVIGVFAVDARSQTASEIAFLSSGDQSQQKAMFYAPPLEDADAAVPLIVALHSWSGNYKQQTHKEIEQWCIEKGWAYIHPDFRGPNRRPQATGSELVVADIVSAVEYAKKNAKIDEKAIYLVGTSGGGYAALLMAGRHPQIWAGVTVWVPIVDLAAWYNECKAAGRGYYKDVAKSCGGAPGESAAVDEQYRKRSANTYLANAKEVPLHINAGIHDGHTGSVPVSHSLHAFNAVADEKDRLAEKEIDYFVRMRKVPNTLMTPIVDKSYGEKRPLFRRTSGNATVTLFDGSHEPVMTAAIAWIEAQYASRQGEEQPAPQQDKATCDNENATPASDRR